MAKSKYLTAKQILDLPDLKEEEIEIPEWGITVLVREMDGVRRELFNRRVIQMPDDNDADFRALVVAMSIVDEHGNPIFSDEHVKALGKKSFFALNRVYRVAMSQNKLGTNAVEVEKQDFLAHQNEDSNSD